MMKLQTAMIAAALAAISSAAGMQPAGAGPVSFSKSVAGGTDVIQIRDGGRWRNGHGHRYYRPGFRHGSGFWLNGGPFIAGAIIGSAIANQGWYDDGYYGDPYYGDGYYRREYYPERVYVAPRSSYRQGFNDGYRAGYRDGSQGGVSCNWRLQDAGQC